MLYRVYRRGGLFPASWGAFRFIGPKDCRFDHHPQPRGVHKEGILYLATDPVTCLAEAFQDTRIINRGSREPCLASFATAASVRVLDLAHLWPTKAGASMAICAGSRAIARKWSRAIYRAYPQVEGLSYCSAMHGNARSIALYERARLAIPGAAALDAPLTSPTLDALVRSAARTVGYGLL